LDLLDRAVGNGVRVKAWTFDEFYGRNGPFLDGLDARRQAFVGEIPPDFRVWLDPPRVVRDPSAKSGVRRRTRLVGGRRSSQVRHLRRHSPAFHDQRPQRYRVKDTQQGADIWEIQWHTCWRRTQDERLVSRQQTLIIARHVLTDEIKYFLANRVPGQPGWNLRALLRVAFGRWPIEACFREAKEELGFDHYECRGWHCIHRHLACVILSQLYCARIRHQFSPADDVLSGERLTLEQVRRATSVYLQAIELPRPRRLERYQRELDEQQYYQQRNAQAAESHRKTRRQRYLALGIDPDTIKSCLPHDGDP
jgi:SRSO17 transposase